ncbi:MAG: hypothetical protein K9I94_06890 [Bacteroidales bacterium]|nr:hypothetical protein [Bacteroidales bacterium]
MLNRIEGNKLTLLYSAKDENHNNAIVLLKYLEEIIMDG